MHCFEIDFVGLVFVEEEMRFICLSNSFMPSRGIGDGGAKGSGDVYAGEVLDLSEDEV